MYNDHINHGDADMKTVTRYEIRAFTSNEYSKSLSVKLRDRSRANKIVKRLKKYGIKAFAVPMKIAA